MANCRDIIEFMKERERICNSVEKCNSCLFTEDECNMLFCESTKFDTKDYETVINKLQKWSDENPPKEKKNCDNSCNCSCTNSKCECKQEDTSETGKEVKKHEYSFDINVYDLSGKSEYPIGAMNISMGEDEDIVKCFESALDMVFNTITTPKEDLYIEVLFYCDGNVIEEFNNADDSYESMIDMIKYHIEKGTTKLGEDTAEFDEDYQRLEEERKKKIYEDFNIPNVKTPLAKLSYLHMKQTEILIPFLKEIVEKYGKENSKIKPTCLKLAVLGEEMCVQLSNATKEILDRLEKETDEN